MVSGRSDHRLFILSHVYSIPLKYISLSFSPSSLSPFSLFFFTRSFSHQILHPSSSKPLPPSSIRCLHAVVDSSSSSHRRNRLFLSSSLESPLIPVVGSGGRDCEVGGLGLRFLSFFFNNKFDEPMNWPVFQKLVSFYSSNQDQLTFRSF